MPISFATGALLPAVIGLLPTWVERSSQSHQTVLAVWQPDPLRVSAVQTTCVAFLGRDSPNPKQSKEQAVWWCLVSYLLAALSSAVGHTYAIGKILSTSDPLLSMRRIYVPYLFAGPAETLNRLTNGTRLFLQYDLIIIALSSLSWAYALVSPLLPRKSSMDNILPLLLLVGGIILGPGATVSLALFWRERELNRRRRIRNAGISNSIDSKLL